MIENPALCRQQEILVENPTFCRAQEILELGKVLVENPVHSHNVKDIGCKLSPALKFYAADKESDS